MSSKPSWFIVGFCVIQVGLFIEAYLNNNTLAQAIVLVSVSMLLFVQQQFTHYSRYMRHTIEGHKQMVLEMVSLRNQLRSALSENEGLHKQIDELRRKHDMPV